VDDGKVMKKVEKDQICSENIEKAVIFSIIFGS